MFLTNLGLIPKNYGRAIAQAVSRWLATAAARIRAPVFSCGIRGGQSGAEVGFLRILRFYLPIFILSIAPQSPSSFIWGWYNRPVMVAVPSGLSHPTKNNKEVCGFIFQKTKLLIIIIILRFKCAFRLYSSIIHLFQI
jgi:hypothetical protein